MPAVRRRGPARPSSIFLIVLCLILLWRSANASRTVRVIADRRSVLFRNVLSQTHVVSLLDHVAPQFEAAQKEELLKGKNGKDVWFESLTPQVRGRVRAQRIPTRDPYCSVFLPSTLKRTPFRFNPSLAPVHGIGTLARLVLRRRQVTRAQGAANLVVRIQGVC